MKRVSFIEIVLLIAISIILSGCFGVKKAQKDQSKEVAEAYIQLRYNLNHENIDNTQGRMNKLWAIEVASDNSYLKEIRYESKLKNFKYEDIDKKSSQKDAKDIETLVINYEVSYKENSKNIKEELKDTLRIDNIQITMFQKESKWLIGEVKIIGSKNILEEDVK